MLWYVGILGKAAVPWSGRAPGDGCPLIVQSPAISFPTVPYNGSLPCMAQYHSVPYSSAIPFIARGSQGTARGDLAPSPLPAEEPEPPSAARRCGGHGSPPGAHCAPCTPCTVHRGGVCVSLTWRRELTGRRQQCAAARVTTNIASPVTRQQIRNIEATQISKSKL